jgi:hypothetical protein
MDGHKKNNRGLWAFQGRFPAEMPVSITGIEPRTTTERRGNDRATG